MMSPVDFEGSEDYESKEDMVPPNHHLLVGLNALVSTLPLPQHTFLESPHSQTMEDQNA